MADHVGEQLGNYRLTHLLGRGGFAEVYLGQHVRLPSQQAAVKILATRVNPENVKAFEHEADTIAALTHPHIVRLLDFDVVEGMPFLVMAYAPNGSLRRKHRGGQIVPLATVVSYVQQIAGGLDYAHYKHVIHRDIKPDNMLLDECNKILLSDFGVATIAHNTTSQSAQAVIGTVAYMAPEQFQEYPRPASDQYALAITVYEWLSGTRPFNGTFTEVAVKHALVPPPSLLAKNPALPSAIEQVVFTALAKDPKARFASVKSFATALAEASQETAPDLDCLKSSSSSSTLASSPSGQLSATIAPRDKSGDVAVGTVIVPTSLLIQSTLPARTSTVGEISTPDPNETKPVELQASTSSSTPVQPVSEPGSTSGKNVRHPSIGDLLKKLVHKTA